MKAKVNGSEVLKFPYTKLDLQQDNNNTLYDERHTLEEWFLLTDEHIIKGYALVDVTVAAYPTLADDLHTKAVLDNLPTFQDGSWVLGWSVVDKTEEEVAASLNVLPGSGSYAA